MNLEEILDRIFYSYNLELFHSVLMSIIYKLLLFIVFTIGLSIIVKANPFWFGVAIVIITAIQNNYRFGEASAFA